MGRAGVGHRDNAGQSGNPCDSLNVARYAGAVMNIVKRLSVVVFQKIAEVEEFPARDPGEQQLQASPPIERPAKSAEATSYTHFEKGMRSKRMNIIGAEVVPGHDRRVTARGRTQADNFLRI